MNAPEFFDVYTEVVVVGTNPEMADYDNPRGNLFGEAVYVYAEFSDGSRSEKFFEVVDNFRDREALAHSVAKAERLVVGLTARLKAGKLPVAFSSWGYARPCYGSEAYVAYGAADDIAQEMNESAY